MLDIDFFKKYNDTYGHDCGDEVLQSLGTLLEKNIRKTDIACRYGGEEFVVIMPDTPLEVAIAHAELIRQKIKTILLERQNKLIAPITVSIGVSGYPQHGLNVQKILKSADMALYRAKNEGKDSVRVAD
jgi:diguanylate cyclase (GGDEF)-like protein